jgi:hypothetical protein
LYSNVYRRRVNFSIINLLIAITTARKERRFSGASSLRRAALLERTPTHVPTKVWVSGDLRICGRRKAPSPVIGEGAVLVSQK